MGARRPPPQRRLVAKAAQALAPTRRVNRKQRSTMSIPTDRPATWFVTGTSRGLGL